MIHSPSLFPPFNQSSLTIAGPAAIMVFFAPTESWPSGRRRLTRNQVYGNVSGVRIPRSPPVKRPQTCSAGLEAPSGPAPRGAFWLWAPDCNLPQQPGEGVSNPFCLKTESKREGVVCPRGGERTHAQSIRGQGHFGWRFGGGGGSLRVQSLKNTCHDIVRTL